LELHFEVLGSNLGWDSGCADRFFMILLVCCRQMPDNAFIMPWTLSSKSFTITHSPIIASKKKAVKSKKWVQISLSAK
jgi:hypothetical protein